MARSDILIIGGGIIGLATGYELSLRFPRLRIILVEKESDLALHQTGRNSGVLHSGIYYKPGSLKATFCMEGKRRLEAFCRRESVSYALCGKVIVATDVVEMPRLQEIEARGIANGVPCERIGPERLHELEPHCAGIAALHVPTTGIIDYTTVCRRLSERFQECENSIVLNARVLALEEVGAEVLAHSTNGDFSAGLVINCAGLYSDRIMMLGQGRPQAQIVPFRGEYFELLPAAHHFCHGLIYPVPNPQFPFLGVHFTRMIMGGVECGPNAVLALSREGYRKTDIDIRDAWETLSYPGFLRLARKHGWTGLGEVWRSFSKAAFVRALQRLVPEIRSEHLIPALSGVRAQAVAPDGRLLDDFMIIERHHRIDVINAPSPAATASLSIAATIADRAQSHIVS